MLLREVHQEGMQVLSLSELPLSEGESGGQFNVEGWAKERDALLATVQSLKGLITQMQTHSQSQVREAEIIVAVCRSSTSQNSFKAILANDLSQICISDRNL